VGSRNTDMLQLGSSEERSGVTTNLLDKLYCAHITMGLRDSDMYQEPPEPDGSFMRLTKADPAAVRIVGQRLVAVSVGPMWTGLKHAGLTPSLTRCGQLGQACSTHSIQAPDKSIAYTPPDIHVEDEG